MNNQQIDELWQMIYGIFKGGSNDNIMIGAVNQRSAIQLKLQEDIAKLKVSSADHQQLLEDIAGQIELVRTLGWIGDEERDQVLDKIEQLKPVK